MAHPFEKIFDTALAASTEHDNKVTEAARKLIEKGYSTTEVCGVLGNLEHSLIDDTSAAVVRDAREELCPEDEEATDT